MAGGGLPATLRTLWRALALLGLLALVSAAAGSVAVAPPSTAAAFASGSGGAVASAEPAATETGIEMLRAGGNAADAAVAVALALAVVHPQAGNLGGGGFAVVRRGSEIATLDFRETAPAAARRDMFLGPGGKPRPDASWTSALAAGVPGSPAGLYDLHRRFGALPWSKVVGPAARLARDGFVVTERLRDAIQGEREILSAFPETALTWLPGGAPPSPGSRVKLPDLAKTLDAYASSGPAAITSGPVAAAVEAASKTHGGILSASDLAAYRPVWRDPLRFQVFGWEAASMPLPSSGGTIIAETCAILERLGWQRLPRGGVERDHLLVEAWRRAYADRFVLGDPETTLASPAQILDASWIASRAREIRLDRATASLEVRPWPGMAGVEPRAASREGSETTHLSVVDASGGMVAMTTTLNGLFGCGLVVKGVGFLLNNEMDDFTVAPGLPNAYGLIQGDANAVRAGKRMLSSMSPLIVWKRDQEIALGSRGGSRIPSSTTQVLLDLVVDAEALLRAVQRPRFHHQWLPDEIVFEADAFDSGVLAELERRGHRTKPAAWQVGELEVVRRSRNGSVEAAADPRGPGGAGVVRAVGNRRPGLRTRSD